MITNCQIDKFSDKALIKAIENCTSLRYIKGKTYNLWGNLKILGEGAYGTVYGTTMRLRKKERNIAIKVVKYDTARLKKETLKEINYAKIMDEENIGPEIYDILHLTTKKRENFFIIIMKKYTYNGYDILVSSEYTDKKKRKIIKKMIKLIQNMIDVGLYCFDIKPSNFVVENTKVRMIDFGGQFCSKEQTLGDKFLRKTARAGKIPEYQKELNAIANSPAYFVDHVFFNIIMLPFIVLVKRTVQNNSKIVSIFNIFIKQLCDNRTMQIAIQIFLAHDAKLFNTFFHYITSSHRRPKTPGNRTRFIGYFLKTFCQ